jgi:hypothetical protein
MSLSKTKFSTAILNPFLKIGEIFDLSDDSWCGGQNYRSKDDN